MLTEGNKRGDNMKLTNSQEEYLTIIYLLSIKNHKIRVTDVAQKLNITKSSVTKAVIKLNDLKLVKYETYGNIELTKCGTIVVKKILEKQDLLEIFLIGVLNVDEKIALEDIKYLQHGLSDSTKLNLKNYIRTLLKINDDHCRENYDKNSKSCQECKSTKIRNKINDNEKWKNTIEGD